MALILPAMRIPSVPRARAFTILELLVVIAILAILAVVTISGMRSLGGAGNFNQAVSGISGLLELSRAHAMAQNTYVWVVFYETVPINNGPLEVRAAAYASNDGTDTLNWTGSVSLPSSSFTPIGRMALYKGLHLQTTSLPDAPSNPSFPASVPVFQSTVSSESGPVTLSNASAVYWVVQFTPAGAARNGSNSGDAIWLGLQPSFSATKFDDHNVASLLINGLTGLVSTHRVK